MQNDMTPAMAAAFFVPMLIVLLLVWITIAIGNGYIAARLGKNVVLWVVLSLIPVVNYFFFIYVGFSVVLGVLDRLNAINGHLRIVPGAR